MDLGLCFQDWPFSFQALSFPPAPALPTLPPLGDARPTHCWSSQIPNPRLTSLDESLQPPTLVGSDGDPAHEADVFRSSVSEGGRGEQTLLVLLTLWLPLTSRVQWGSSIGMIDVLN